jgi:hypothetical protein
VRVLDRLEPGDTALVIGNDAAPIAFLLAAHDVEVVFTGNDMTFVDQVESRVSEEALGHYCATYVAPAGQFGCGIPERVHLVAIDTGTLESHRAGERRVIIERLMARTHPCGVHLILPSEHAVAPEAFICHYAEWTREDPAPEKKKAARSYGVTLGKPPEVAEPRAESPRSRDVPA